MSGFQFGNPGATGGFGASTQSPGAVPFGGGAPATGGAPAAGMGFGFGGQPNTAAASTGFGASGAARPPGMMGGMGFGQPAATSTPSFGGLPVAPATGFGAGVPSTSMPGSSTAFSMGAASAPNTGGFGASAAPAGFSAVGNRPGIGFGGAPTSSTVPTGFGGASSGGFGVSGMAGTAPGSMGMGMNAGLNMGMSTGISVGGAGLGAPMVRPEDRYDPNRTFKSQEGSGAKAVSATFMSFNSDPNHPHYMTAFEEHRLMMLQQQPQQQQAGTFGLGTSTGAPGTGFGVPGSMATAPLGAASGFGSTTQLGSGGFGSNRPAAVSGAPGSFGGGASSFNAGGGFGSQPSGTSQFGAAQGGAAGFGSGQTSGFGTSQTAGSTFGAGSLGFGQPAGQTGQFSVGAGSSGFGSSSHPPPLSGFGSSNAGTGFGSASSSTLGSSSGFGMQQQQPGQFGSNIGGQAVGTGAFGSVAGGFGQTQGQQPSTGGFGTSGMFGQAAGSQPQQPASQTQSLTGSAFGFPGQSATGQPNAAAGQQFGAPGTGGFGSSALSVPTSGMGFLAGGGTALPSSSTGAGLGAGSAFQSSGSLPSTLGSGGFSVTSGAGGAGNSLLNLNQNKLAPGSTSGLSTGVGTSFGQTGLGTSGLSLNPSGSVMLSSGISQSAGGMFPNAGLGQAPSGSSLSLDSNRTFGQQGTPGIGTSFSQPSVSFSQTGQFGTSGTGSGTTQPTGSFLNMSSLPSVQPGSVSATAQPGLAPIQTTPVKQAASPLDMYGRSSVAVSKLVRPAKSDTSYTSAFVSDTWSSGLSKVSENSPSVLGRQSSMTLTPSLTKTKLTSAPSSDSVLGLAGTPREQSRAQQSGNSKFAGRAFTPHPIPCAPFRDEEKVSDELPGETEDNSDADRSSAASSTKGGDDASDGSAEEDGLARRRNNVPAFVPVLTKPDYWTEPSVEMLESMDESDLSHVVDFKIGRHGFGNIWFQKPVNLTYVNLDTCVEIRAKEVVVHSEECDQKLNKPAIVSLEGIFPPVPEGGAAELSPSKRDKVFVKFGKIVQQHTDRIGARFVSYDPEEGRWMFRVDHFSGYSFNVDLDMNALLEDDENDQPFSSTIPASRVGRSLPTSSLPSEDVSDSESVSSAGVGEEFGAGSTSSSLSEYAHFGPSWNSTATSAPFPSAKGISNMQDLAALGLRSKASILGRPALPYTGQRMVGSSSLAGPASALESISVSEGFNSFGTLLSDTSSFKSLPSFPAPITLDRNRAELGFEDISARGQSASPGLAVPAELSGLSARGLRIGVDADNVSVLPKKIQTCFQFRACFNPVTGDLVVPQCNRTSSNIVVVTIHEGLNNAPKHAAGQVMSVLENMFVRHAADHAARKAFLSDWLQQHIRQTTRLGSHAAASTTDLWDALIRHDIDRAVSIAVEQRNFYLASLITQTPIPSEGLPALPSGHVLSAKEIHDLINPADTGSEEHTDLERIFSLVLNGDFQLQQHWWSNLALYLWYRCPRHVSDPSTMNLASLGMEDAESRKDIIYLIIDFASSQPGLQRAHKLSQLLSRCECDYELAYRVLHFFQDEVHVSISAPVKCRVLLGYASFLERRNGSADSRDAVFSVLSELPDRTLREESLRSLKERGRSPDFFSSFSKLIADGLLEEALQILVLDIAPDLLLQRDGETRLLREYLSPLKRAGQPPNWFSMGGSILFEYCELLVHTTDGSEGQLSLPHMRTLDDFAHRLYDWATTWIVPLQNRRGSAWKAALSQIAAETCRISIRSMLLVLRTNRSSDSMETADVTKKKLWDLIRLLKPFLSSDMQLALLQNLLFLQQEREER